MKVYDLKITNMVKAHTDNFYKPIVGSVAGITLDEVTISSIDGIEIRTFNVSKVIGINITPDRLIDLGFENFNSYYTIKIGHYNNPWVGISKSSRIKLKYYPDTKCAFIVSPGNGSVVLKYIHELQNLYDALTGNCLIHVSKNIYY